MNPASKPTPKPKKRQISQQTAIIMAFTLITSLIWAGLDIYRAATKTSLDLDIRQELTPLNPDLDSEVLSDLEKMEQIPIEEVKTIVFPIEIEPESNSQDATTSGEINEPGGN